MAADAPADPAKVEAAEAGRWGDARHAVTLGADRSAAEVAVHSQLLLDEELEEPDALEEELEPEDAPDVDPAVLLDEDDEEGEDEDEEPVVDDAFFEPESRESVR